MIFSQLYPPKANNFNIEGIAQCSLNPKIDITFETTLPYILRQDPDVIVLGEIRDRFSAEAAIQAALTGHKVLTTFHTEDTIGGLLRLMNMKSAGSTWTLRVW